MCYSHPIFLILSRNSNKARRINKKRAVKITALFLYNENPRIVRGFKRGFADEQKRAEEKVITIRQKEKKKQGKKSKRENRNKEQKKEEQRHRRRKLSIGKTR